MALHDYAPLRTMAFGIAGLSVVADSLSAIKHAKVRVVRDETGLVTDYQTEGEFPVFGNNDNRVDQLAVWVVSTFMNKLRQVPDLSRRGPHPVGPDDHVERRVRQGDRQHAGRAPARRAVRAGRQPDARPRQPRHPRRRRRRSPRSRIATPRTASRSRRRWCPTGLGPRRGRPHHQPDRHPRRVLRQHRLPHERQRAEPRDAARRDGSSGEVPEPHDPRVGLRGQLRAAHARAADGRHQPHVPRGDRSA